MPSQAKPNVNTVWASGGLATPVLQAKQALGFVAEIPDYDDFNGMIQQISAFQKHVNQEGIPVWDALTAYFAGGFAKGNNTIYVSLADHSNQALPPKGGVNTYWADLLRAQRVATDTGVANALVANFTPAITTPIQAGSLLTVLVFADNTGPTTLNINGLGATAVYGLGGVALQGGELKAGKYATFMYNPSQGCMLVTAEAGALQVAPATKSGHAAQLAQTVGRLVRTTTYINAAGVLQSSVNGSAYASASAVFTPLAVTTATDVEVQASGGSGGGCAAVTAGQIAAGSGGGAGGYARGFFTSGFTGLTVSVGAARPGTTGGGGTAGQASSFGGILSSTGGGGGSLGTASGVTNSPAGSAAGGGGSGGYLNVQGGGGGYAFYSANPVSGGGGGSMFGAGASYVSGTFGGTASTNYGSGGGGASLVGASSAATGGASAGGFVTIREYVL